MLLQVGGRGGAEEMCLFLFPEHLKVLKSEEQNSGKTRVDGSDNKCGRV